MVSVYEVLVPQISFFFKKVFHHVIPRTSFSFNITEGNAESVMANLLSPHKFLKEWISDKYLKTWDFLLVTKCLLIFGGKCRLVSARWEDSNSIQTNMYARKDLKSIEKNIFTLNCLYFSFKRRENNFYVRIFRKLST